MKWGTTRDSARGNMRTNRGMRGACRGCTLCRRRRRIWLIGRRRGIRCIRGRRGICRGGGRGDGVEVRLRLLVSLNVANG